MICISRTNTRTIPVPTSADQACWNPRRGRNGNEISSVAATMEPRPSDGQDLWISGCVRYVDVYYPYGIHIIHWPSPTCISGLRGWGAKNIKNSCLMLSLFYLIVPVFFRWFSGGLSKCPFLFFGMAIYVSVVVAASSAISQGHDRCKYGVLNAMNDHRGVVKCAQYGGSYLVLKDVPIGREGWRGAMT